MCFDRFLLAFESRDLSQADKSIIRVSSFPSLVISGRTFFSVSQQLILKFSAKWIHLILSDLPLTTWLNSQKKPVEGHVEDLKQGMPKTLLKQVKYMHTYPYTGIKELNITFPFCKILIFETLQVGLQKTNSLPFHNM